MMFLGISTITGSCNTELALPSGLQACVKIPCSLSYSLEQLETNMDVIQFGLQLASHLFH